MRHAPIVGRRVLLRAPTRRDAPEMLRLKRRNREHLAPWEATAQGGPSPFSAAWFDGFVASARTAQSRRFLICRTDTGEIIGQVGLGGIIRGAFQSCFLGYWISRADTGKGLMSEAVGLALAHAFGELRLHRVEANVIPENARSVRMLRRLGFRREGLARRYLRIAGKWQDHAHWAMTLEDWRGRHARGRRARPLA